MQQEKFNTISAYTRSTDLICKMDGRTNERTNGWMNEQMNEQMNERTNEQMNKRTNIWTNEHSFI